MVKRTKREVELVLWSEEPFAIVIDGDEFNRLSADQLRNAIVSDYHDVVRRPDGNYTLIDTCNRSEYERVSATINEKSDGSYLISKRPSEDANPFQQFANEVPADRPGAIVFDDDLDWDEYDNAA